MFTQANVPGRKRSRYTREEKIGLLVRWRGLRKNGMAVVEAAQAIGVCFTSLYHWCSAFGLPQTAEGIEKLCGGQTAKHSRAKREPEMITVPIEIKIPIELLLEALKNRK